MHVFDGEFFCNYSRQKDKKTFAATFVPNNEVNLSPDGSVRYFLTGQMVESRGAPSGARRHCIPAGKTTKSSGT